MNKIANYNCEGMCIEKCCNQKYTRYIIKKINGMNVMLGFCDKHAGIYEAFEDLKEHPEKDMPIVFCQKRENGLKFFCKYCGDWHLHGKGEGHRVSHCSNQNSPYIKTGYILKELKMIKLNPQRKEKE